MIRMNERLSHANALIGALVPCFWSFHINKGLMIDERNGSWFERDLIGFFGIFTPHKQKANVIFTQKEKDSYG